MMGVALLVGCLLNTFALPFALFIVVIARDPLRVILFVLGMFFWLLSLLLSAVVWTALYPLRESHLWVSLIVTVAAQELMRVAFFYLLKFAEAGLLKVAGVNGVHVSGVHSLVNARHVMALVCGLGYGVMGGLFGISNVAVDSLGPGVPGLPHILGQSSVRHPYYIAALSSGFVAAMILLQVVWTVIAWNGLHHWRVARNESLIEASGQPARQPTYLSFVEFGTVIFTHYLVVFCSLMNDSGHWLIYLMVLYSVLIFCAVWALRLAGITWQSFTFTAKHAKWHPEHIDEHTQPATSPTSLSQPRETEVRQRNSGTASASGARFSSEPIRC